MRTADCSSVHWLPMKQMTHEHRRRSILMFSTGSSVCCRLAGEVPVQPAAAKDCEMQAILGFKNVCWRMEIRRRVRTSSWSISLTHFKCFMKPTLTCYYTCDERLAIRWGAKLLAFSLCLKPIAPDQTSELKPHRRFRTVMQLRRSKRMCCVGSTATLRTRNSFLKVVTCHSLKETGQICKSGRVTRICHSKIW